MKARQREKGSEREEALRGRTGKMVQNKMWKMAGKSEVRNALKQKLDEKI